MVRRVHRMGDLDDGGGSIHTIPQSTVFVENLLVAVEGSKGTGHPPCPLVPIHCDSAWTTVPNTRFVFVENKPVIAENDTDSCGHKRVNGSSHVFIG